MNLKRTAALLFTVIFLALAVLPCAAAEETSNVKVFVNNKIFEEGSTKIVNGLTYVPLRAFCDNMGACEVIWNSETGTATIKADGLTVIATAGDEYISANGRYLFSASKNYIGEDNRLYVPIRAIAKAYGAPVTWDAEACAAIIGDPVAPIESGDTFYNADDVYWLSRIISAESRGEPMLGQVAVGNVVLNRMKLPGYPKTVYGIIFDTRYGVQFTPIANGTIYEKPYDCSVIAAKICLEGYSVAEDILFFMNPSISASKWMMYNCRHIVTIANHAFYAY